MLRGNGELVRHWVKCVKQAKQHNKFPHADRQAEEVPSQPVDTCCPWRTGSLRAPASCCRSTIARFICLSKVLSVGATVSPA